MFINAGTAIKEAAKEFSEQTGLDLEGIIGEERDFPGAGLYHDTLAMLHAYTTPQALHRASAELNSLDRILDGKTPNRNDQLHFLASETPDGALAARVMADFCKEHFKREAKPHLIEGLQVRDGTRFRRYGLRNLIDVLYDVLEDAPASTYTRILNPTGGFKGVVPYLTIIGMIEPDIEVSYIYEQSPEMITLAGLPITLDYARLADAFPALKACNSQDMVPEHELLGMLGLKNRSLADHPAWSLFQRLEDTKGRFYALNGLGQIVYRHLEERGRAEVYLSRQAAATYDSYDKTRQERFAAMFDRMGDASWRQRAYHATKGDAKVLKQGNTDERPLILEMPDGSVLVAELTLHSDGTYDRTGNLRRKDYDKFRKWEG